MGVACFHDAGTCISYPAAGPPTSTRPVAPIDVVEGDAAQATDGDDEPAGRIDATTSTAAVTTTTLPTTMGTRAEPMNPRSMSCLDLPRVTDHLKPLGHESRHRVRYFDEPRPIGFRVFRM
jgi:hypothetical protein